jgi:predicted HD phosphohydrolase
MSLARALYRSRQFFRSVGASLSAEDRAEVAQRLNAEQQRLFYAMTARDQRHCLDVFHALQRDGHDDPDLLLAALLHDVGKGPVRLWHRVAYVLIRALSPRLLRRLSSDSGSGWRQALASFSDHSRRGAVLVETTGAPEAVVALVRLHSGDEIGADPRVALLRAADESC